MLFFLLLASIKCSWKSAHKVHTRNVIVNIDICIINGYKNIILLQKNIFKDIVCFINRTGGWLTGKLKWVYIYIYMELILINSESNQSLCEEKKRKKERKVQEICYMGWGWYDFIYFYSGCMFSAEE